MKIDPSHFEYLVIQRGEVSDERHDFAAWKKAYEASIGAIFNSIRPCLPVDCKRVIDVGSGLGGIDVLIAHHYTPQPVVVLVDGENDPARVEWHHKTFSNMKVALDFQDKNGVKYPCYFSPYNWPKEGKADLVVSFAAYCFHICPADYLEEVKRSMHKKTVLIFDVRRTRRDWLETLVRAFGKPKVVAEAKKYVRCVFNVQ